MSKFPTGIGYFSGVIPTGYNIIPYSYGIQYNTQPVGIYALFIILNIGIKMGYLRVNILVNGLHTGGFLVFDDHNVQRLDNV